MKFYTNFKFCAHKDVCKVVPAYILYNLSFFADMIRYLDLRHLAQKYRFMGIKNKRFCPNQFLGNL
jgi:hypothetical protein